MTAAVYHLDIRNCDVTCDMMILKTRRDLVGSGCDTYGETWWAAAVIHIACHERSLNLTTGFESNHRL